MTYAEILAEIQLLSKRGDIDDKIAACIRTTTLRAHRLDYFWRDRIEVAATWATASNSTDIAITTLTRFRAIDYVRYYDPDTTPVTRGTMIEEVDPRVLLDDYNYEKTDVWYMAGTNIRLKFLTATRGVEIGYFSSPIVHPAGSYVSWIADQLPDLIIQGSLAMLFNMTGKQEEARAINAMVGFDMVSQPNSAQKGPTLVEQLRAFALEAQAR